MENSSNEKRPLKLNIKTFVDLRRFTSKQLHKIVEKFRAKNRGYEEKYANMSAIDYMKESSKLELLGYKARRSLVNLSDRQIINNNEKYKEQWEEGKKELKEKLDNEEITEKQYRNQKNQLAYKIAKKMYAKDMVAEQEKPKNPRTQRIIRGIKKVAKAVGMGVAFPFVMTYKGVRAIGKGIATMGRGGKVAALTAGKVVSNTAKSVAENVKNQVGPIAQEVKETENAKRDMKMAEKSKELDDAATISAKREIYDNSSEKTKSEIKANDWKAALREDKKYEAKKQAERNAIEDPEKQAREEQRRENLHMDKEEQHIDHKGAVEKVEAGVLTREEEQQEK